MEYWLAFTYNLYYIIIVLFFPGLCEVETGQSNIVLDIEESRGNCKLIKKYKNNNNNLGQ